MIEFTCGEITLAYTPRVGATIEQVRACREIVADRFGLNLYAVRLKFKN